MHQDVHRTLIFMSLPPAAAENVSEPDLNCAICRSPYKLPITLSCGHRYCFFCIKDAYVVTRNCPTCRNDIPEKEIEKPVIQTNDIFKSRWLYQGRDGVKWWLYDEETSELIEQGYRLYLQDDERDDLNFYIGNTKYAIDFGSMKQYRVDSPLRARRIRRTEHSSLDTTSTSDTISEDLINGIAGIKIVKVPPPLSDDSEVMDN